MNTKRQKRPALKAGGSIEKAKKSNERQYIKFTENNDHEGETWHFYILSGDPLLSQVKAAMEPPPDDECALDPDAYRLDEEPIPESHVDVLVRHSGGGYMPRHNKVTKIVGRVDGKALTYGDLYKGGPFRD